MTAGEQRPAAGGRRTGTRPLEAAIRVPPTALPILLLVTALVAGCSGGGDSPEAQTAASSGGGGAYEAAGAAAEGEAAGADREATGGLQVTDLRAAPGAAVIRTADLEVRVEDVRAAAAAAGRVVRTAGGRVEAEDRTGTGSDGSASLSLRAPPAGFDGMLADLAVLGEEQSRRVGSEDVTDQVVDGFGDGLRGGWSALTTVGRLLAVTAGALLPFLPLLLLAGVLGWRLHLRRTQVVRA